VVSNFAYIDAATIDSDLSPLLFACSAICIDAMDSPAFLPCGHSFCRLCVVNHFDIQHARSEPSTCPTCSRPSEANDLLEPRSGPASSKKNLVDDKFDGADAGGIEGGEDEAGAGVGATGAEGSEKAEEGGDTVLVRRGNFKSSTKLDALLRHLTSVEKEEPNFKALVFSCVLVPSLLILLRSRADPTTRPSFSIATSLRTTLSCSVTLFQTSTTDSICVALFLVQLP
jgi:hypothetical protein